MIHEFIAANFKAPAGWNGLVTRRGHRHTAWRRKQRNKLASAGRSVARDVREIVRGHSFPQPERIYFATHSGGGQHLIHFMPSTLSPKRRAGAGLPRRNGTDRTKGNGLREGRTTTCAVDSVRDARVEAARLWRLDAAGRALSKKAFIELAIDVLTRLVLKENPSFKLPPSCEFGITEAN